MANYFTDRVVQYPGRVNMTPVSGQVDTYDMARAEGAVSNPGTPFSAEAFNAMLDKYGMHYGTCSSSRTASTKVVNCPGFTLEEGATIAVKFTYQQDATGTCYLNVNNTGAKKIFGIPRVSGSAYSIFGAWGGGETKVFVYDGTDWQLVDGNIITNTEMSSLESTLGVTTSSSKTRLNGILEALAGRSGTTVSASGTRNVPSGGTDATNLCSVTIPSVGVWLIVSNVFETMNGSAGDKTFQNRIEVSGQTGSFVRSPNNVGRTVTVPNCTVLSLFANTVVDLNTYLNSGSASQFYGVLWAIKVA